MGEDGAHFLVTSLVFDAGAAEHYIRQRRLDVRPRLHMVATEADCQMRATEDDDVVGNGASVQTKAAITQARPGPISDRTFTTREWDLGPDELPEESILRC